MSKKKAVKRLAVLIVIELVLVAVVVWLFDPFYQYHAPFFRLQQVLYDRDNQVAGSLRNLDYDSVLLGSSVAENFDSSFLDRTYDCSTLKVIRASGSVADLLYYMEQVHEEQDISRVFWCMDIFALTAPTEVTLYAEDVPRYLHTDTIWDDLPYVYNKEILLMKIPLMLAYSYMDINTGGHAYDWSDDKEFSAAKAMLAYDKPEQAAESLDFSEELSDIEQNIQMVMEEIQKHPEIEYTILFPPYSMLWWDCGYVNGMGEKYFYVLETVLPALLSCDNVSVYFFQSDREIICNLDNYMDMIHYSPQINQYMLECVAGGTGTHRVTGENLEEVMLKMRETYDYIINEGIYSYYPESGVGSKP